jgi:AraC-like DNA-binding protein
MSAKIKMQRMGGILHGRGPRRFHDPANRWSGAASGGILSRVRPSTLDELARDPVGRWLAGEGWLHFCAAPTLWGVILWGRPGEPDAAQLGRSLVLELAPPAVLHASIIDASRLSGSDPSAFRAAERYLTHYADILKKWVSRVALLRPRGLPGATVAGAYEVLPRPYPVAVFDQPAAAFRWLEQPEVDLDALYAEATGTPHVVGALRALLDQHLRGLSVAEAATTLGISERTLQRKLGEAGTGYLNELAEARVRAARRLLLESDAPLTAIAYDVGCASLQHFSALFRKRTGESPSAFRRKRR